MSKILKDVSKLRKISSIRPKVSHKTMIKSTLMALILAIAFLVRVLPVRWGYYLNEFDPYVQYRQTKYIIENGLWGPNGWVSWHDYMSWYPWGTTMSITYYPGLPVLGAVIYKCLSALGIPLVGSPTLDPLLSDPVYILCVVLPPIMATLACLAIYFLGKDLGGEAVGLFASFFLALDASYISRTALGFYDDESVGVLTLILVCLFFLRSIEKEKPLKISVIYAVAAGLSLGYLCATWGAARYPINMIALFTLCLILMKRYSTRLFMSYVIVFAIALSIAMNVPRLGSSYIYQTEVMPVYGVFLLLIFSEISKRTQKTSKKTLYYLVFACLISVFFILLWYTGLVRSISTKFLAVLIPSTRFESTIFESVAEHRPSAWGTFYYNWGIGTIFLPVGLYFAIMSATNIGIFMAIFGITTIYFASSMIRITILVSPVISLLWALAIVRLLKPFILSVKEQPEKTKKKYKFRGYISKEMSTGIIALMFIFLILTYVVGTDFMLPPTVRRGPRVFSQAYSPTTIAAAGMSVSSAARDWLDALTWIRENLPPSPSKPGEPVYYNGELVNGTVVASWWDYGYWITAIANRTSLADNGSWNMTQIQQIGLMFMSNETEAVKILRKFNVTHVVVFVTFTVSSSSSGYNYPVFVSLGGDNAKWQWMAKIPGLNDADFGNLTGYLGYDWHDLNRDGSAFDSSGNPQYGEIFANSRGQNTTLYKLMRYGAEMTTWAYSSITLQYFEEAYFSRDKGSAYSGTGYIPLVCVYKVKYPAE